MSKYYGNPKYTEQLVSYYTAKNNLVKSHDALASLAPQDQVITFQILYPNPNCCPPTSSTPPITSSILIAPILLTVTSGSAILSWSYSGSGQTGFNIERSFPTSSSYSQYYQLANPDSRSYVDANVSAGNTYWYRIDAYNALTTSLYSNTASITFAPTGSPGPVSSCKFSDFPAQLFTESLQTTLTYDLT